MIDEIARLGKDALSGPVQLIPIVGKSVFHPVPQPHLKTMLEIQPSPFRGKVRREEHSCDDLFLWAATDIPVSLRTMLLDSLSRHRSANDEFRGHDGSFGGGGATGSFDAPSSASLPPAASDSLASAAAIAAGAAVGVMVSADASGTPVDPIATDDRLGAFS